MAHLTCFNRNALLQVSPDPELSFLLEEVDNIITIFNLDSPSFPLTAHLIGDGDRKLACLECLANAISSPLFKTAARPTRLVVDDPELAQLVEAECADIEVGVVVRKLLGESVCPEGFYDVEEPILVAFFDEAEAFLRAKPWEHIGESQMLELKALGLTAAWIGGNFPEQGMAFFEDLDEAAAVFAAVKSPRLVLRFDPTSDRWADHGWRSAEAPLLLSNETWADQQEMLRVTEALKEARKISEGPGSDPLYLPVDEAEVKWPVSYRRQTIRHDPDKIRKCEQELALLAQEIDPESNRYKAQALAFEANFPTRERPQWVCLDEALKIDPECIDALVKKAEEIEDDLERHYQLEMVVGLAANQLEPGIFKKPPGTFWARASTRPYMRAQRACAIDYWVCGDFQRATEKFWFLLVLNPMDEQGNRFSLAELLFQRFDFEEVKRLCDSFPADASTAWLYTQALCNFRLEGDTPATRAARTRALKANSKVASLLLTGECFIFRGPGGPPGTEGEARAYLSDFAEHWLVEDELDAATWLVQGLREL